MKKSLFKNSGNSWEDGGSSKTPWNGKSWGVGVQIKRVFRRRGMDIFWNFTFTRLNNLKNDSNKTPENQKLTRFLSGCLFVYTFCQFLQADSYLRAKNFTNTCQWARFTIHDCRSNFTSQVAGPSDD